MTNKLSWASWVHLHQVEDAFGTFSYLPFSVVEVPGYMNFATESVVEMTGCPCIRIIKRTMKGYRET